MAQGYVLVLRPSEPGNKDSKKLYYAQSKSTGIVGLKYLAKFISARSTVSSADVKAVLDSLNWIIDAELQEGRIVQLGELGNLRISVSSEGVEDKTKFSTSMIRPPRLVFTPGSELRITKKTLEYTHVGKKDDTVSDGGNTGGGENPDENPDIL